MAIVMKTRRKRKEAQLGEEKTRGCKLIDLASEAIGPYRVGGDPSTAGDLVGEVGGPVG